MPHTTTITYDPQRLTVTPANLDVLGGLRTERYVTVHDPHHGYRVERQPEPQLQW